MGEETEKEEKQKKTWEISPSTRPTRARLHPRSRSRKGVSKTPGRNRKAEKQKKPKKYHPRPDRRGPVSIRDQDLGKEFPRPPEETEKQKNREPKKYHPRPDRRGPVSIR